MNVPEYVLWQPVRDVHGGAGVCFSMNVPEYVLWQPVRDVHGGAGRTGGTRLTSGA